MLVYKCDSCGEMIEEKKVITVRYNWDGVQLCPACGWEVVDFLQDKKLIKLETAKL